MSIVPRPGGLARVAAPKCHARHIRSPLTSYERPDRKVKLKRRERYPNLSPTRPPTVAADMGDWAHWIDVPVEALDLDAFAENGALVRPHDVFARWGA